jgi:hypothetical protein
MARGNLFLLGHTKSGKTSVARLLEEGAGLVLVSASAWARRGFAAQGGLSPEAPGFVEAISAYSAEQLRQNPNACIDDLRARFPLAAGGHVIEGIRNPRDFAALFDYRHDGVLWLEHAQQREPASDFERGLSVIAHYLDWLSTATLWEPRCLRLPLKNYEELPEAARAGLDWWRALSPQEAE